MNKLIGVVKVLVVMLVILSMTVLGGVLAVYYENWEKDMSENDSNLAQFLSGKVNAKEKELEPNVTCLVMGRNQALTDFIVLMQYNPNTREVSMLSIPRDTFVGSASVDGKINSIYANKGISGIRAKVEELTGIEVNYHVLFDASILKKVVNELGGVTVDVPINMDYDDPYQNPPLHIHLKKGTQLLSGSQAEQFVRFRKNNNGTGYPNGDIGRIDAQQRFIKALISELLKGENIGKVKNLAQIVINGTKTDVSMDVVEEYLGDLVTFKMDRMRMDTLPGLGQYKSYNGLTRSYYIHDEEASKILIDELFNKSINEVSANSGDILTDTVPVDKDIAEEVFSSELETEDGNSGEIKIELLIAKAKNARVNELAEILADNNCNVVKLGNYQTVQVEPSRIITYGQNTDEELEFLKEISGIKKVEESDEKSNVKFTIIIGANY